MSKIIQWIGEGYAFAEKVANQKKGVEMRLDGEDVSSVDWEGAFDAMVSEARAIVSQLNNHMKEHLSCDTQ